MKAHSELDKYRKQLSEICIPMKFKIYVRKNPVYVNI